MADLPTAQSRICDDGVAWSISGVGAHPRCAPFLRFNHPLAVEVVGKWGSNTCIERDQRGQDADQICFSAACTLSGVNGTDRIRAPVAL